MPNTLWLWVFWALSSQGSLSLSQRLRRWVALKRQKPCINSEHPPIYGVGGGLFIATRQPDLICPKWSWVNKELTRVPTVRFQNHVAAWLGLQVKLTHPARDKICSHCLRSKTYDFGWASHQSLWLCSLGPHLTVRRFLWLNKEETETTKQLCLRTPWSSHECLLMS